MTNFTKEQMDIITAQSKEILEKIAEGTSVREIMAQLYVDNLDDKTIRQGTLMTDAIFENIAAFDRDYFLAKENLDMFIEGKLNAIAEGKSLDESCRLWLKLTAAISGANLIVSEDSHNDEKRVEALLKEIEQIDISGETSPELEAELRAKTAEALKNSGLMLSTAVQMAEQKEIFDNADQAAAMLIDLGSKEVDYRAVSAMLAYVNIKNGTFDNFPAEMTIAQVSALVCASMEQVHILEEVSNGNIGEEMAADLLTVLGIVAAFWMFNIAIDISVLILPEILAIPAIIMLFMWLWREFALIFERWEEDSKKIVHVVAIPIKLVFSGIKRLAVFSVSAVIPAVVEKSKELISYIKNKIPALTTAEDVSKEECEDTPVQAELAAEV